MLEFTNASDRAKQQRPTSLPYLDKFPSRAFFVIASDWICYHRIDRDCVRAFAMTHSSVFVLNQEAEKKLHDLSLVMREAETSRGAVCNTFVRRGTIVKWNSAAHRENGSIFRFRRQKARLLARN